MIGMFGRCVGLRGQESESALLPDSFYVESLLAAYDKLQWGCNPVLNRGDIPTKVTNIFSNTDEKQGTTELLPYQGQPTEITDSGYSQDRKLERFYSGGRVLRCVTQIL